MGDPELVENIWIAPGNIRDDQLGTGDPAQNSLQNVSRRDVIGSRTNHKAAQGEIHGLIHHRELLREGHQHEACRRHDLQILEPKEVVWVSQKHTIEDRGCSTWRSHVPSPLFLADRDNPQSRITFADDR